MRSDGTYTDFSSQCATRGLTGTNSPPASVCCRQFQPNSPASTPDWTLCNSKASRSIPRSRTGIDGGTQDNGTFLYEGSSVQWGQTAGGDGGQSGFNAANPNIRFHTYYAPQVFVNFQGTNTLAGIGSPIGSSCHRRRVGRSTSPSSTTPTLPGRQHLRRLQGVWRTTDNGGAQAGLDLHCNNFTGDFSVICGALSSSAVPPALPTPRRVDLRLLG